MHPLNRQLYLATTLPQPHQDEIKCLNTLCVSHFPFLSFHFKPQYDLGRHEGGGEIGSIYVMYGTSFTVKMVSVLYACLPPSLPPTRYSCMSSTKRFFVIMFVLSLLTYVCSLKRLLNEAGWQASHEEYMAREGKVI